MRPLRCSIRPGFHGRSKWKRSAQWAWKLRPSRAASVAIRIRSGSSAGSVLKRRWISLRAAPLRQPRDHRDPLVGPVGPLDRLLEDRLEVALRALAVLGEDQHPPLVPRRRRPPSRGWPNGGRPGHWFARIQSSRREHLVRRADARVASAISSIWSSSACSRAPERGGGLVARRGRLGASRDDLELDDLVGLELLPGPVAALVVGARRRDQERGLAVDLVGVRRRRLAAACCPLALDGPAVDREAAGERLDR